jgi:D-lactate dehydrogenase
LGFDLHGKTVGVIGTGNIGKAFAKIVLGFGCKVLAFDINKDQNGNLELQYELDEVILNT